MWMMTEETERDWDSPQTRLGPLESEVMKVLWSSGECGVREVMLQLPRSSAYTTVMTTLVRLFEKKLVERREVERRFLYLPRITAEEFKILVARRSADRFLATLDMPRKLLLSCLVDAISLQSELLTHVENKIRETRAAQALQRGFQVRLRQP